VTMIIAGGTICSSLLSERLTRRLGTRVVTTVSVLMTAAALAGFSTASAFWMLCVWAIPYGLGAGAVDAALNNYVALHYSSRHMSWLHSFWGVGALISPYVMSWALRHATWHTGYRTVSMIQFGIAALLLLTASLWRLHKTQEEKTAQRPAVGIKGALRIPGVPTMLTGFFCLLQRRGHHHAVDMQLLGVGAGHCARNRRRLCQPVLYRHDGRAHGGRLYHR
jgi:MFS family permease